MPPQTNIEQSSDAIQNRLTSVELYAMTIAGQRLAKIYGKEDLTTYLYSAEALSDSQTDLRKIEKALNKAHRENLAEMNSLFKTVTAEVYTSGQEMAEHKNTRLSPLTSYRQEASPLLRQAVRDYEVMSRSTTLNSDYKKTIRQYVNRLVIGDEDNAPTALRKAVKELTAQGISTIDYESGRSVRMDTAVRNSLMTEYTNIVQQVQNKVGQEIGADAVEISGHQHSAEDHEPIQGRIFTLEEFEKLQNGEEARDVDFEKYEAGEADYLGETFQTDRPIGMWNCRHIWFPFILGVSIPSFSKDELEAMQDRNEDGIDFKGEHYTLYEGEQAQRKLEAQMRAERENLNLYKEVRETSPQAEHDYQKSKARLAELRNEYKELGAALEPKAIRMKWDRASVPKGSTGGAVLPNAPNSPNSPEIRDGWSPNFQEKIDRIRNYNSPHNVDTDLLDAIARQEGYKSGQEFTASVNGYIKENQVMMRFDNNLLDNLKYWADDPVIKNKFETVFPQAKMDNIDDRYINLNTSSWNRDYLKARLTWENKIAGEDINFPTRERPVYGFVGNRLDIQNNTAREYGESFLVFKETVKARSTFMLDNSSNPIGAFTNDVSAMFNKGRSISNAAAEVGIYNSRLILNHSGEKYMEAQIWGSADIRKDVEKIVLGKKDLDFVRKNEVLLNKLKSKIGNVPIEDMAGNRL